MNIGMVLDNEFTGDIRVENEVMALEKAGFKVFVLCFNFGSRKDIEKFGDSVIVRIRADLGYIKKLRALTNTIFNFYPTWWAKRIFQFVKEYKIDVLHLHDLYMFGAGIKVQKKLDFNLPLVGDLHENYVEGLKKYIFSNTFPGNILISIPKWERKEIEWISKMDYSITVIEEAINRYSSLGLNEDKITVVANYVNIEEYFKMFNDNKIEKNEDNFIITYIGAFDRHRGLESVVRAAPKIIKHVNNLKIVLVGSGKNLKSLKELAADLNVQDNVSFEGFKPHELLPGYINASDICIIPHLKTEHTDNTIPHKLFQYMLFEKPVIASNCNPIKRIVELENCGLIYESDDSDELAEKVLSLFNDKKSMVDMGRKGKDAVLKKYNWDMTSKNLIDLYKKINKRI